MIDDPGLTGSTKYPEHLVFKRIGGLFTILGEAGEFAERRAARVGFANKCKDSSEGRIKCSAGSEAPPVEFPPLDCASGWTLPSTTVETTASDNWRPNMWAASIETSSLLESSSVEDDLAGKVFDSVSLSSSISKAEVESIEVCDMLRSVWMGWALCTVVGSIEDMDKDSTNFELKESLDGRRGADSPGHRGIDTACEELEGRLEPTGLSAGVEGPSCPWSNICSRVANSCLTADKQREESIESSDVPTHLASYSSTWSSRGVRDWIRWCTRIFCEHMGLRRRTVSICDMVIIKKKLKSIKRTHDWANSFIHVEQPGRLFSSRDHVLWFVKNIELLLKIWVWTAKELSDQGGRDFIKDVLDLRSNLSDKL